MSYEIANEEIETFISQNWDEFIADAERLIAIDSSLDKQHACDGAPFGPGPRRALDEMLGIAKRFGFMTFDGDGYAGYADIAGQSGQQLGVIGHVDVVPAGIGWTFEPFQLTYKDGIFIGRGTADDKIPLLSALYAVKFWLEKGISLKHDIRFIVGCNEETGMEDVSYYLAHNDSPDFLFTPDADFPLCYGEKGLFGVTLKRDFETVEERTNNAVASFEGGVATNAVPALAQALVKTTREDIEEALRTCANPDRITFEEKAEGFFISATGVSGHASLPEGTVNAIGVLADFLARLSACSSEEQQWFAFVADLAQSNDGSAVGIASADKDFGSLTSVVGTMKKMGDAYILTDDIRFPASISGTELQEAFEKVAFQRGASVEITRNQDPFLVNPNTAPVQALVDAYQEATGLEVRPFTMGGATYAREFPHAVSFGPADPEVIKVPDWVGEMHGADEGVSEEAIKHAIRIYIRAFGNLAQVDKLS